MRNKTNLSPSCVKFELRLSLAIERENANYENMHAKLRQ